MNSTVTQILNDENLVFYQREWFDKLREVFEGDSVGPLVLWGVIGRERDRTILYEDPGLALRRDMQVLAERAYRRKSDKWFVPFCVEGNFYGVHFIDKIFGAEVFFQDGQWYNRYLNIEIGELEKPDLEKDETWRMAREYAQAFLESGTTVPLLGLPTIASALNIAINLYGEEILVAMLTDPDAAKHDLEIINQVLIEIHQWYLNHIPMERLQPVISWERTQPPGYGQLCGCSTQLLSPALYEEFVMPLDNALLGVYPHGGMIHLCGNHEHLLPLFARMENLKSVQLNDRASEGLEKYVKGLREDQVIYLNPCAGMPIEKALEIAKGRKLVVVGKYDLEELEQLREHEK